MDIDENHGPEVVLSFNEDIVICNFSDCKKTRIFEISPQVKAGPTPASHDLTTICCEFFPHEFNDADENYIALHFMLFLSAFKFKLRRWSSVVSVVSVEGQPKFLQSVTVEEDFNTSTYMDCERMLTDRDPSTWDNPGNAECRPCITYPRFIGRRVLFDEDQEYLPGDTLTLRCEMEVTYELNNLNDPVEWALEQQHFSYSQKTRGHRLNLNSPIYSSLRDESPFFEGMLRSGMQETDRQWMHIYDEEYTFANMLYFIESGKLDHVHSACSLLDLYELSDKYLFRSLTIQCRRLISETLTIVTAPSAMNLAVDNNDQELKNCCSNYIRSLSFEGQEILKNRLTSMNAKDIISEFFH